MPCRKLFPGEDLQHTLRGTCAALILLLLTACGGGGGGGGDDAPLIPSTPNPNANVQPINVTGGPGNGVNLLMTSVTLCTPGSSSQCQTIDNILVDTGSFGLRVMASVLNGSATPTTVRSNSNVPLVQCTQFADGFTWGPVKRVDVRIASEIASDIPIQIVGDPAFPTVPTACQNTGDNNSTVAAFGANGVLGIGVFEEDCGPLCNSVTNNGIYYQCNGSVCSNATASLPNQVRNPVGSFAINNNGVVIDLPAVPAQGAVTLSGSMIFGIGTQNNNSLGNARIVNVNPNNGTFTTLAPGQSFPLSFIDTGSNGLFFPYGAAFTQATLPTCGPGTAAPEFFCPTSTQTYSNTIQAFSNGTTIAVDFSIDNAVSLLNNNPGFHVFSTLGAPIPAGFSNSFDWGLPFYFGRRVHTALENRNTPAGVGPYVAF
ncbi:MAG: DUF3443 domain-containing protein [Spongiibacteraceae bacterium]